MELRSKLVELSELKAIKQKKKFLEGCSEEALKTIWDEYERKQLEDVNKKLTEVILEKFSHLMGELNFIRDKYKLSKDLQDNDLLKDDMKKIVGYVTPYLPFVGIVSGGITVAGHVVENNTQESKPKPQKDTRQQTELLQDQPSKEKDPQ